MKRPYHIYECEECCLVFAVEQAHENQEDIVCPLCQEDEYMIDIGEGEM